MMRKDFECCYCKKKFPTHGGPENHAKTSHRNVELHFCPKPNCVRVVSEDRKEDHAYRGPDEVGAGGGVATAGAGNANGGGGNANGGGNLGAGPTGGNGV